MRWESEPGGQGAGNLARDPGGPVDALWVPSSKKASRLTPSRRPGYRDADAFFRDTFDPELTAGGVWVDDPAAHVTSMLIGVYIARVKPPTSILRKECLVSTLDTPLGQPDFASTVLGGIAPAKYEEAQPCSMC